MITASCQRIFTISKATFSETVRDRVFYSLALVTLLLVAVSWIMSKLTYGHPERVALHFGLTAVSFCAVAIAIFIGVGLVRKELEKRTIYTLISKPLERWEFLIGKYLGLAKVLFLNILLMGMIVALVLLNLGFIPDFILLLKCLIMQTLEALVVLSFTLFFSTFFKSTLTVICSIGVYLAGIGSQTLLILKTKNENPMVHLMVDAIRIVIPDLNRFNIRNIVFYEDPFPILEMGHQTLFAICYILGLFLFSMVIFQNKDFP